MGWSLVEQDRRLAIKQSLERINGLPTSALARWVPEDARLPLTHCLSLLGDLSMGKEIRVGKPTPFLEKDRF